MPRFLFWSDLHTEYNSFLLPDLQDAPDAIFLGGDLAEGKEFVPFILSVWEKYKCPVIAIHGNHEFYGSSIQDRLDQDSKLIQIAQEEGADIRLLDATETDVSGYKVFGATLWTDFNLYGTGPHSMLYASQDNTDFKKIYNSEKNNFILPEDVKRMHQNQLYELVDFLHRNQDTPTIVMTHFAPSERCLDPKFAHDRLNPCFAANLDFLIDEFTPEFWLFGHTHTGHEFDVQNGDRKCRVIHNSRGMKAPYPDFNPERNFLDMRLA